MYEVPYMMYAYFDKLGICNFFGGEDLHAGRVPAIWKSMKVDLSF
jgi:hypothetical protein